MFHLIHLIYRVQCRVPPPASSFPSLSSAADVRESRRACEAPASPASSSSGHPAAQPSNHPRLTPDSLAALLPGPPHPATWTRNRNGIPGPFPPAPPCPTLTAPLRRHGLRNADPLIPAVSLLEQSHRTHRGSSQLRPTPARHSPPSFHRQARTLHPTGPNSPSTDRTTATPGARASGQPAARA